MFLCYIDYNTKISSCVMLSLLGYISANTAELPARDLQYWFFSFNVWRDQFTSGKPDLQSVFMRVIVVVESSFLSDIDKA